MTAKRVMLVVLVILFFGPLAVSFTWYFGLDHIRPTPTAQKGELIDPPRPLPSVRLPDARSEVPTSPDFLEGKWSIVYFGDGGCADRCRARLAELRQMRAALGRERGRVQQVFLYTGEAPEAGWLDAEHPLLVAASVAGPAADALLAEFPGAGREALIGSEEVFLVDPLGNLMMRYPPDTPLRDMHDDLGRLLRLSTIG